MNPKRSEIFENFAKVAIEKGLIKVEAEAMTEEEKHRNSEWKDNIRALYGINPDGDKEDILDKAHPKPVIIAPSYDKVNGLVENLKERHDIMMGIALKPNNGNLTNHKYAEAKDNLLRNLIRLGYMLDNRNIEDLRKLADSCSEKMVKNALPIAGALLSSKVLGYGVAAIAGIIAIINHTTPSDQGVLTNIDRAIEWITEAQEDVPQIRGDLSKLSKDLLTLKSLAHAYMNLNPVDISTPGKFINAANSATDSFEVVKRYKKACQIMAERLPRYIEMLRTFKTQTKSWGDWVDKLVDVYRYFDPDDAEEAAKSLETLRNSLIQSVKEAVYFMQKAKQQEPSLSVVLEKHLEKEQNKPKKTVNQKFEFDNTKSELEELKKELMLG